ncbi:MAG: SAM-dependent methyltransferase, partial [Pseudomonadota bacterium]
RTALGDTFQAIQAHAFADPLADPGQADLTSHVDFEAIAKASAAAGAKIFAPVTQSQFLLGCGLLERAGQLGAGLSLNAQDDIRAAVQRLAGTGEGEMGALFNALCFAQPDCPKLPPFHAD